MDTINSMRAFVAVAGQNSFTQGAKQLSISTNLASKYVRQLEGRLGAQLLNRTTRSVTLTETGHAYYGRCLPILDQLNELEGIVQERQSEVAGAIRITAPTAFGSRELVGAISQFQLNNPKVSIDLFLSDQRIGIIEDGFDLAVRFGELKDSSLIARKLTNMRVVVFASPDYLKKHGKPLHPDALATYNCLLQTASVDPEHWGFSINGKQESFRVNGSFHANSPRAVAYMAAGGLGIGRCPMYIAEPFIQNGQLTLLFEDKEITEFNLYAIYPSNRHLTIRIRALIDFLIKEFSESYKIGSQ